MMDGAPARLLLLADGEVGLAVAQFLLSRDPCPLVGIVVVSAESAVAQLAKVQAASLPLVVAGTTDRQRLADQIRERAPDMLLLAWWPFILKDELACGQRATLNMHPSLLPYGRGKDPNFWALANGEPFGVSIHHVVPSVDEGDIAFQQQIHYDWTDNGSTLYRRAQEELLLLLERHYAELVSLRIPRLAQDLALATAHRRADLETRSALALDSLSTPRALLNLLRARSFSPHPGCRFTENGQSYEVRISIDRVDPLAS